MYLTRIVLDGREAISIKLSDAYAWHQRLWEAFPDHDGEDRKFLSRTEVRDGQHQTLLLSPQEPFRPDWGLWEIKPVAPIFLDHSTYLFDLRANPVVSKQVHAHDGQPRPRGRRRPVLDPQGLSDWMHRKAETHGFVIDDATLQVGAPVRQPFRTRDRSGVHTRVDFRGVLTVQNRQAFQLAFHSGIGPAKAFGFGLFMLQPFKPVA